jgi:hypothetical protein
MTKEQHRRAIWNAENMVRESAYHLCKLQSDLECPKDEAYSRSCVIYRLACDTLKSLSAQADAFINATYNPKGLYAPIE